MGNPHILAIPFPGQGHVIPLMEFSQCLVEHGFKVTFVNTEYNHRRVLNALAEANYFGDQINLVSLPDGMEPWEDRNDIAKLCEATFQFMPGKLEELIDSINASEDETITCVIADENMGWALEMAEKMKINRAAFWPASAAILSSLFSIPKLIEDGIIDNNGIPLKKQMIQLAPNMPAMSTENLLWAFFGNLSSQKIIFDVFVKNNKAVKAAEWIICNSVYDLEPGVFTLTPNILPIGPLLASNRLGDTTGHFWLEDFTCLKWLDQQQPNSVTYVAFGSHTIFKQTQFQELGLGLELSNRPFLWVVRPDITSGAETNDAYPAGFLERVGSCGQIVAWAPQQKVLSHPSIACFLSHCGWNSTMEGVSNGVPFLCWPNSADQFLNESYICDVWKVGLKLKPTESGIITREEIKNMLEKVICDENFKARALELKEIAMKNIGEDGYSKKIFKNFIDWMKT